MEEDKHIMKLVLNAIIEAAKKSDNQIMIMGTVDGTIVLTPLEIAYEKYLE